MKCNTKGSALILAILLTLVLSSVGLVAMYGVAESMGQSETHVMRHQVSELSLAALQFRALRCGENGSSCLNSVSEASKAEMATSADVAARETLARRGPMQILTQDSAFAIQNAGGKEDFTADLPGGSPTVMRESGFLSNNPNFPSFERSYREIHSGALEQEANTNVRVVIRDLELVGPSEGCEIGACCAKRFLLGSEARIGEWNPSFITSNRIDLRRKARSAYSQHAMTAMIENIECDTE